MIGVGHLLTLLTTKGDALAHTAYQEVFFSATDQTGLAARLGLQTLLLQVFLVSSGSLKEHFAKDRFHSRTFIVGGEAGRDQSSRFKRRRVTNV